MNHLDDTRRVFVTGLDRGRMAAIARILVDRGYEVAGTAGRSTPALEALAEFGVDIEVEPSVGRVQNFDLLVHPPRGGDSAAVDRGRDAGLEVVDEASILAEITASFRTIGVTGTHGRATVAAMIAWILESAGREPGFAVSTRSRDFGVEGRDGTGRWFVVEIDERLVSHRELDCDYVVCNFLDLQPRDYYEGEDEIVDSMRKFLESNRRSKEVFVNLDCRGNRRVVRRAALRPTGYALEHQTEFRGEVLRTDEPMAFRTFHRDDPLGEFELDLPGAYNIVNALGALAVGVRLRIAVDIVADALRSFRGLENRYTVGSGGGVTIVKDFVRHPASVERLVDSARERLEGRLIGVFAPRSAPASAASPTEYASALEGCDEVVVADRSEPTTELHELLEDRGVAISLPTEDDVLSDWLLEDLDLEAGDNVLFVGDDEFLRSADHLQAELAARAGRTAPEGEQPRFDGPLTEGDD